MKVEVLCSTMEQVDHSLVDKMNLQTDAIIINQKAGAPMHYDEFNHKGRKIRYYTFNEKGVGLSRNTALNRLEGDIGLIADDDMVYVDGYEQLVIDAFKRNRKADIILFNVPIYDEATGETKIKVKRNGRVHYFNSLKYGAVNIAFRKNKVLKKNLAFSLLFGGGTGYSSGEDSLFIYDALKKGLKIYSSTTTIAHIHNHPGQSTWFTGYHQKYIKDKGAAFQALGGSLFSLALILQFILRKRSIYTEEHSLLETLKLLFRGRDEFRKL